MKFLFILMSAILLFTSNSFAKQPDFVKNKKAKSLPYGLQKKLAKGGELPPGWKKKIIVGKKVPADILSKGVVINPKDYGINVPDTDYTKIYKIQDTIIRVNKLSNVILDILKN